jgi:ArsR family transcriptional regulator, arsenate/arsenite/antimonite-responsive transcriptional repressor
MVTTTNLDASTLEVLPSTHVTSTTADMTSPLPTLPGPSAADCCAPSAGLDPKLDAQRLAALAKALAEPVRVQIIDVLRRSDEPVCQCEFIALLDIKQSLLSHHIKKLVEARLVTVERRHKWAYYSIAPAALKELTAWLS